jgi:dipeptidyl aminopeptidase/acylaminoacyl peptidase
MNEKTSLPFGLWPSPIVPASLAQSLSLRDVAWDSDGETLVWLEGRSDQGVLVCAPPGEAPRDLTSTLSVRARVGYGGGDFAVARGHVYYVAQEGRLYRQALAGGQAQPITPQFGHMASPTLSPDGRWMIYVHTYERVDGLAIVDAEGRSWPGKLVYGQDFYMQPCWHPDGTRIAWISWDHPNMPWESTMLKMATLDRTGQGLPVVTHVETLVDKPDVAVAQPQFSPDGKSLVYLSDENGWSNLYLYDLQARTHCPLTADPVEIGGPAWAQGMRSYAFSPDGERIYTLRNKAGFSRLWAYDLPTGEACAVDSALNDYTNLSQIAVAPESGTLAFLASSSAISDRVVSYAPGAGTVHVHRRSTGETVPAADLSTPQPVSWAADDGTAVHGLYYPPTSSRFVGSGLPPAIVNIHGGPTSQKRATYNARAQFYTTRGYAYLEVNYRGSTGYGKHYMALLRGKWGILDVKDAVGGARYLVDAGLADADRLVIMGGSAGGYTVLKTLIDHPGTFKAALCLYGVSNMYTLAADTHKFEERYLDSLLGPLPEASAIYRDRSPIFHAEGIVDPVAIFQGEIDRVVPKSQSETIVASLQRRGVPHEYHVYEGEGHGWRKRETIEAFYKTVEAFLKQYVIFA